ncbi:hypothetical protein ACNAUY_08005 [Acinetobacter tibetensis]|uniref:hypothetical protein n=1 Tax=Acinetobacter tibetensis TaxID=2943497 RepID=UPI003A4E46B0
MNINMTQEQAQYLFDKNCQLTATNDRIAQELSQVTAKLERTEEQVKDQERDLYFVNLETMRFLNSHGLLESYVLKIIESHGNNLSGCEVFVDFFKICIREGKMDYKSHPTFKSFYDIYLNA